MKTESYINYRSRLDTRFAWTKILTSSSKVKSNAQEQFTHFYWIIFFHLPTCIHITNHKTTSDIYVWESTGLHAVNRERRIFLKYLYFILPCNELPPGRSVGVCENICWNQRELHSLDINHMRVEDNWHSAIEELSRCLHNYIWNNCALP